MPFKSKAQQKKFFAMESQGEIPKGTADRWAKETPNIKNLPNKKRTKKANLKLAFEMGLSRAIKESGLDKEAGLEKRIGDLLRGTSHLWAPAAAGGVVAGPEHRTEGALAGLGLGILGKGMGLSGLRRSLFEPRELQKAMRAAKLRETGSGYARLSELGEGSRGYKRISEELGESAPQFFEDVAKMKSQGPLYSWGGRIAGGAGGGYLANQLLSGRQGGGFQTSPAISDISTHYTGLVPGEDYY